MPVELEEILRLARTISPATGLADIHALSGGFNSQAYKVGAKEPFVLLVARPGGASETRYDNAFVVLNLLKRHGFAFAPDPLWLAPDHSAIAISYFDGTASDKFDFAKHSVDQRALAIRVIDALLDMGEISIEEYQSASQETGAVPLPPETLRESAQKYGTEWFELVERSCPDAVIIDWLRPRIAASVQAAETGRCDAPKLVHSDPSNPNILIGNDGSFKLIDWSGARPHCTWAQYLVGYTTHLTDFMNPFQDELIAYVAQRLTIPEKAFADSVFEYRKHAEVYDVNWAAMMMAKVATGETSGDVEYFRKIALDRIREYDRSFS